MSFIKSTAPASTASSFAEADVWTLFRRILGERKRRELDPTLALLERTVAVTPADSSHDLLHHRLSTLRQFFGLIEGLAARLSHLEPSDLDELRQLIAPHDESES